MDRLRRLFTVEWKEGSFVSDLKEQRRSIAIGAIPAIVALVFAIVTLFVDNADPFVINISYNIIAAALFIFLTLVTLLVADICYSRSPQANFRSFFGSVTAEAGGVFLIFASRETDQCASSNEACQPKMRTIPRELGIVPSDAAPKGITDWIPVQDLRGAIYISGAIARFTGKTAVFRTDKDLQNRPIDQMRPTIISFGLGFNHFTYQLIALTEHKLFDVKFCKLERDDIRRNRSLSFGSS